MVHSLCYVCMVYGVQYIPGLEGVAISLLWSLGMDYTGSWTLWVFKEYSLTHMRIVNLS